MYINKKGLKPLPSCKYVNPLYSYYLKATIARCMYDLNHFTSLSQFIRRKIVVKPFINTFKAQTYLLTCLFAETGTRKQSNGVLFYSKLGNSSCVVLDH